MTTEKGGTNDRLKLRAAFAKKLNKVIAGVDGIAKTGKNEKQNYHYAEEAEVVKHVRKALVDAGLSFEVEVEHREWTHEITARSGSVHRLCEVLLICELTDTDTGYTRTYRWLGDGLDPGDKAIYKAYTSGVKYFLMKNFLLPTGDDVEAAPDVEPAKTEAKTNTKPQDKKTALKAECWSAFKIRCKEFKQKVPTDKEIIHAVLEAICMSGAMQDYDMTHHSGMPVYGAMRKDAHNEGWRFVKDVLSGYNVKDEIARQAVKLGKTKEAAEAMKEEVA